LLPEHLLDFSHPSLAFQKCEYFFKCPIVVFQCRCFKGISKVLLTP
jgi:hypothetical protein